MGLNMTAFELISYLHPLYVYVEAGAGGGGSCIKSYYIAYEFNTTVIGMSACILLWILSNHRSLNYYITNCRINFNKSE